MTSVFAGIALGISLISLVLAWRSHRRADRAEERADRAEERADRLENLANEAHDLAVTAEKRADDEARRKSVQFEFTHANAPHGEKYGIQLHFRHTGNEEIHFVSFDPSSLSQWEIRYSYEPTIMRPGQSMYLELHRNRKGQIPDAVTVKWSLPFEGEQVVPIPQDAFPTGQASDPSGGN